MNPSTPRTLPALLAALADEEPDAPALLSVSGEVRTRRQLQGEAHAISRQISDLGAPPGATIAVCVAEGPALARALVGTMHAHAAAPLSTALTARELGALCDELAPRALVAATDAPDTLRSLASARDLPLVELPRPGARPLSESAVAPSAGQVALVLHTSGTTGRPKLVPLSHGNLAHALSWVLRSLALTPRDRCLNAMPMVHSHGLIGALLASLAAGGSVVCAPEPDPRKLLRWAEELGCTWTTGSPTLLRLVLEARGTWPHLRLIRSASAPMPPRLAEALEERFGVPQIQVYGLTEAYQVAANPLPPAARRRGSVGLPTGCEVMIRRAGGEPAPRGETGEILVRGPNVFAGYGTPEGGRDRSLFVEDWFRTGDEGFLDDEGHLHVSGRLRERINRGGEKIAPLEVERVLEEHPRVEAALCFPLPDPTLGEEIGALIVAPPGSEPDASALRRFASESLAPFKVPRYFWFRDALPEAAGGKLRRHTLARELGLEPGRKDARDVAPGAGLRDALRALWAEQLGLAALPGDDQRFFDLGGTSLGLVELMLTIERRFGVHLPLSAILEAPTLAELARLIEAGGPRVLAREIAIRRDGFEVRLLPIRAEGSEAPLLFVAPAGGSVLPYYALADRLPSSRPFWGLQIDVQRRLRRPFSIPELAEAFVEGLEQLAPRGAPILGGWSFGAFVAYEIGARLLARGKPVGGVLALDAWATRYGPDPRRERLVDLARNLVALARHSRPLLRDELYARLAAEERQQAGERARPRRGGTLRRMMLERGSRGAEVAALFEKDPRLAELRTNGLAIVGSLRHYLKATRRYAPPRAALAVDVLKAEESSDAPPTLGWEHVSAGPLRGHLVPGNHFTMLTPPHVEGLARTIAALLPRD